jgi:hypothetical protein
MERGAKVPCMQTDPIFAIFHAILVVATEKQYSMPPSEKWISDPCSMWYEDGKPEKGSEKKAKGKFFMQVPWSEQNW